MIKYGYRIANNERICNEYVCDCCGKHLGEIEIIFNKKGNKERDDIIGWNFCPFCGEKLWREEGYRMEEEEIIW